MLPTSRWSWLCVGLAGSLLVGLLVPRALGQARPGDVDQLGNKADVEAFTFIVRGQFEKLLQEGRIVQDEDKKTINLAAKVLVFQVTWLDVQNKPDSMYRIRKDFERDMDLADRHNAHNYAARKELGKQLVHCFKKVFALPFDKNRLACVNAGLMLPSLARIQETEVGDFLADLLADPKQHGAIKLYAVKALAELAPATELAILKSQEQIAHKRHDLKRVDTLLAFIKRKWDPSLEDREAFHFIRREAIRALAQTQIPAVEADGKAQKVDGPVAYGLLSVLASKPVLDPPPKLLEKVEAAIGICQMKSNPNSLYQPDLGMYRAGNTLVEFANAYRKDHNDFFPAAGKRLPIQLWRVQAERLDKSLKDLVKNTGLNTKLSPEQTKNAKKLLDAAQSYLFAIKKHQVLDNVRILSSDVSTLRPKSAAVFRTIKEAAPIGD